MWLDTVKKKSNETVGIYWKPFQLDQVNGNSELVLRNWNQWTVDQINQSRSMLAAIAGESVRKRQPEYFNVFHKTLLELRHAPNSNRIPLNNKNELIGVADNLRIDTVSLAHDLENCSLIQTVSMYHYEAIETYGVFGTPTFVFENGNAVYLKTFIPPPEQAVGFFDEFLSMMSDRSYIGELKRPQPPWPKGLPY